ncbi:MAG TPA: hypothetical protein VFZ24_08595 [Longimicrobiales bacterium]
MPHVDEGMLHAYIDGALDALSEAGELPDGMTSEDVVAHLDSCADCRARLEAEREVRERAGHVLRDASLAQIEPPPFAGLEATSRARRRRALPLAWAASLLMAAGAGWWGSALWRPAPQPEARSAAETATSLTAQEEAEAHAPAPPSPSGFIPAEATERTATPPTPREEIAPVRTDPQVGRTERRDARIADRDAGTPVVAADAGNAASRDIARAAPLPDSGAVAAPAAPPVLGDRARVRLEQPAAAAPATQSFVESVAADAITPFITPGPELLAFENVLVRERADRLLFRALASGDTATVADQFFLLEDAADPELEIAPEIAQTTLRIRQVLRTGTRVELITWQRQPVTLALEEVVVTGRRASPERAGDVAAKAGDDGRPGLTSAARARLLSDGRHQLVLYDAQSDTWIAIRANLSEAELRELAARLTRGTSR